MGNQERERPPVPEILGLHKGKIEARREVMASRRRLTFAEKKADLFIIDRKAEDYLKLAVLGIPGSQPKEGEITAHPLWLPRVELVSGAIYLSKWDKPQTLDPERYVAFGGRKYRKGLDLGKAPQSWTSAWLIPGRYETIEDAIEGAEKIVYYEGLGGPVQARVEQLFVTLNGISEVFLHEEVDRLRLEGLSRQAESLLREHGLLVAKDRIWKKIADYTLRATSRDRRNRVNDLVSRILARAAYLEVVHQESRQRAAREKAFKLFFYLTNIQAGGISVLENAEMFLENIGGFPYSEPIQALRGEGKMDPRESLPIQLALLDLAKTLRGVEVAPYGPAAHLAEAILVGERGKSNREIEEFERTLTKRGKKELGGKSAVDYLMGLDSSSAKKRLFQAFNEVHKGLTPPRPKE